MKKCLAVFLAVLLAAAVTAPAVRAEEAPETVPFTYTGSDPMMAAICDWTVETLGVYYDTEQIQIPAPVVFYTDSSDPEDIRVWGNFWIFGYTLQDTLLFCESGGEAPGLLHLKAVGDGYEVTSFDACGDGADYDKDIRRICGEAPEEAGDLAEAFSQAADNGTNDAVREEYLRMYAEQAPYPVTAYQDYGWDAVPLEAAAGGMLLGGWKVSQAAPLTDEEQAIFEKALGEEGQPITPVVVLARQLVSGTNYLFLAQEEPELSETDPVWKVVKIYEDLSGNAEVLSVADLEFPVD